MTVLDRTCTEISKIGEGPGRPPASKPLSEYQDEPAYVLLGDPGAGKSTSFQRESERTGDAGVFVAARDFVTFDVARRPEWRDAILFIDGLDEIRAGDGDARTALDRVRGQLDRLDRPSFRLSCREADWLGGNDRKRLEAVAPDGRIKILRLDPLNPAEAEQIATAAQVRDAATFISVAGQKGLGDLLGNPQNLKLLASAVAGGRWPRSRRELFALACGRLVQEENEEHHHSVKERPAEAQLLDTAGRICALLLLSGIAGVDPTGTSSESEAVCKAATCLDPTPADVGPGDAEAIARVRRLALSSRLFRGAIASATSSRCLEPVHRHLAEFLAARYLAQRVSNGLPAARLIALITAGDGGVVTAHRGLSAWLAAHSMAARANLIDRDPVGVGLYGDIADFSTAHKKSLFEALIREGLRLHNVGHRGAAAFAPLAAPELEPELHAKLMTTPQSDDDQLAVEFVLRLLRHGAPMAKLAESCLEIVYGAAWWPRVRLSALDAFVRQREDHEDRVSKLKQVLADIQEGTIPDLDNEMSATVLDALYPEWIPPAEVWDHLDRCQPTELVGRHRTFWTRTLEERTADKDLAVLLDELVTRRPDLARVREGLPRGRELAERLLARALVLHGKELTPSRLHDWLGASARTHPEFFELQTARDAWKHTLQVRSWLEEHPDAYKAVFIEGVRRATSEEELPARLLLTCERLRDARPPSDFLQSCPQPARQAVDRLPVVAARLFRRGGGYSSQDPLDERGKEHADQKTAPQTPSPRPRDGGRPEPPGGVHQGSSDELREAVRKHEEADNAYLRRRAQQEQKWLEAVREEAPALRENRGNPALLHALANEWFDRTSWLAKPLAERLRERFDGEEDLTIAAHEGLRGVIDRDDLPRANEIVRLYGESRMHYLAMPFLASLEDRERAGTSTVEDWPEQQQRQALAFYYCSPVGWNLHAGWYRRLVKQCPGVVERVLLTFVRSQLRRGREHVSVISSLAHDADHAELARRVSLPLLRGFPVRCRIRQLPDLIRLLWTALRSAARQDLLAVVEKKLAGKSMTVNQRVHWLAAGLVAAPDTYASRLADFIDGNELRARQLADFLWSLYPNPFRSSDLPPHALEVLLCQLGRALGHYDFIDGPMDSIQETLWRVPDLIEQLAASPEPEAGAALHRLKGDEALHRWRHHLRMARDRQAVVSRDSSYRRPELRQIHATLDNLTPANAADLTALALHRLDALARSVRTTNTNDWSQYWNQDGHGRPTRPKAENDCRNALLRDLRTRLPDGVDAQPEGQYAANRRADIRLSCSGFHLPIEIKKHSHPALYRAARDQLVAKYTQDPATGGHGIFLALWFGGADKAPLDETGTRPGSPEELRERLEACLARQLPHEQRRKIAVRVIDVSKP